MQYDRSYTHRWMIRDSARTEAFRSAIFAVVKPGDVVLDVGAGSGILGMFAAQAGAKTVYSAEPTEVANLAAHLVWRNGLSGTVHVIQADAESLMLPEPVDVIVSEWLGTIGVDENLLGMVLTARDRWLKPGGKLIPARVTAFIAPASIPMRPEVEFFYRRPYGLDLSLLSEPSVHELLCLRRKVLPKNIVADPAVLWETELSSVPLNQAYQPFHGEAHFTMRRQAQANTLAAWFVADMGEGISLSNAPEAPETHWGQLLLPLRGELTLNKKDAVDVRVSCIPAGPCITNLTWALRVNDGEWEQHDTRYTASLQPHPEYPPLSPGAQKMEHPTHSDLTKFLARLAIDPNSLRDFIVNPTQMLKDANLPEQEQRAMISRNPMEIQAALYKQATQGGNHD